MELQELIYNQIMEQKVILNKKQEEAFGLMRSGKNVFLTGNAGTGKSFLIKAFVNMFKADKCIGLTSTTGISSILIGGVTMHSYLGIGLGKGSVESMLDYIYTRSYLKKRWCLLETLIIDEVSMLSPVLFDKLELLARSVRRNDRPFGGIQLILTGDFLQLPCVGEDRFCFQSKAWGKCIDNVACLTEIVRQDDKDFQHCLNNIRLAKTPKSVKDLLDSRVGVKLTNDIGIIPTKLFSLNYKVDAINDIALDSLAENEAEFLEYDMIFQVFDKKKNRQQMIDKLKKNCTAPYSLQICEGAQVMLLHNLSPEEKLMNGSRGVVTRFVKDKPYVKFLNGVEKLIDYHVWELTENDNVIASAKQIPLKVAYACSIHKMQGSSLDYAEMDLSDVFEYGQAYVALSRVRTLEGLSIIDISYDKIKAHPEALLYYETIDDKPPAYVP